MDIFLLILGFLIALLGIIGSFLPILPGPFTSWVGLLILHFTDAVPMNWTFLGITLAIAILIWIVDYFIPAIGTKKFGGTRYGVIGTMVGLVIGLIAPIPFGIIIGPFVGAYIGEMLNEKNSGKALKAAFGSFIGFLTSSFMKFIAAVIFTGLYISIFWDYKAAFFSF
ncbi:MAG: DUF456 domain-containing protein [Lutibacter sp.]|uniref:DUF456 domain-containing protein n=1 Tax=Lutibacter sp. TaxID=1925666 RepID=UPI001843A39E|nr:DUF456 domain-containing protein [Lutibacter sp.]MBT8317586.1 DUF456 domain-containing protein [Lutibacter sp.]NNJ58445.1 DUF456 domain-containing protein [Lutibacter sp.]